MDTLTSIKIASVVGVKSARETAPNERQVTVAETHWTEAIMVATAKSRCLMIKLVYIVRKRDDVSDKEFHEYWLHKHGPLVKSVAKAIRARKYVQSHTILPETAASLSQSRGMGPIFEGITEVWWDSVEDVTAGTSTAEGQEAGRLLMEDEAKFIDFKRSTIFFTEEQLIFDFTSKV
jgi:uncharacterized protein (TIGR02118 family)